MSEVSVTSSAAHAPIARFNNGPKGVSWVALSFSGAGVYHLPISGLTQQTMGLGWSVQTTVDGSTKVASTLGPIYDSKPAEAANLPWSNDVTVPNGGILNINYPVTGLRITVSAACTVYIAGR